MLGQKSQKSRNLSMSYAFMNHDASFLMCKLQTANSFLTATICFLDFQCNYLVIVSFFKICRRLDNLNSFNIIQTSTLAKEMFVPSITVWNFTKNVAHKCIVEDTVIISHFQIRYTRYIHK